MGPVNGNGRKQLVSDINVTPLVDVMLVLLIIFMVTAPMMTQGLDVDLTDPDVMSTPGFFVNGRYLRGAQPFSAFKVLIDEELGRS